MPHVFRRSERSFPVKRNAIVCRQVLESAELLVFAHAGDDWLGRGART